MMVLFVIWIIIMLFDIIDRVRKRKYNNIFKASLVDMLSLLAVHIVIYIADIKNMPIKRTIFVLTLGYIFGVIKQCIVNKLIKISK